MLGITGTARPVSYYDGETDHEANYLNENRIATIIENGLLWGNETLALDPLWRFVNVRRTRDAIHKAIVQSFRWRWTRTSARTLRWRSSSRLATSSTS
ncbi:MAG: hypothetical protein R3D43_15130 [Tepidamorphaceae bacterium]